MRSTAFAADVPKPMVSSVCNSQAPCQRPQSKITSWLAYAMRLFPRLALDAAAWPVLWTKPSPPLRRKSTDFPETSCSDGSLITQQETSPRSGGSLSF
mmetsp:Transcript_91445/g.191153  ORF Transcript_91445/g.191153 Transcript_91445/m.191153 type:complete len:98 (+) Transcript_91445:365-658(+)